MPFASRKGTRFKKSGYVIPTLKAAPWSFWTTETFREGASKAVNLGDDADTVGDTYGGLAGAWYGARNIPRDWMSWRKVKSIVDEVVEDIGRLVKRI